MSSKKNVRVSQLLSSVEVGARVTKVDGNPRDWQTFRVAEIGKTEVVLMRNGFSVPVPKTTRAVVLSRKGGAR